MGVEKYLSLQTKARLPHTGANAPNFLLILEKLVEFLHHDLRDCLRVARAHIDDLSPSVSPHINRKACVGRGNLDASLSVRLP